MFAGQSNAIPLGLPVAASGKFAATVRHYRGGTAISQWQKGQPLGDELRNAIAATALGQPLHIVWVQGEGDSTAGLAPGYETALRTFLTQLKADLGNPHVYVVGINAGLTAYPERATVRAAQVTVAAEDPRWHLVDPDSITAHDGSHYTTPGYEQLGALVWAAIDPFVA